MITSEFIPTEIKRRASQTVATPLKTSLCENTRQIAQHIKQAGHQANSLPTPSRTERWALPKFNVHLTNTNRTLGELLASIPIPSNDGPPSKVRHGHDTVYGPSPAASSPADRSSGAAVSPRCSRRTHDEFTTSQRRNKLCRLRRQRRGPRVFTQGSRRSSPTSAFRQLRGTPSVLLSSAQEHTLTQLNSHLILRTDTDRQ